MSQPKLKGDLKMSKVKIRVNKATDFQALEVWMVEKMSCNLDEVIKDCEIIIASSIHGASYELMTQAWVDNPSLSSEEMVHLSLETCQQVIATCEASC
jgi:hypothetical protein